MSYFRSREINPRILSLAETDITVSTMVDLYDTNPQITYLTMLEELVLVMGTITKDYQERLKEVLATQRFNLVLCPKCRSILKPNTHGILCCKCGYMEGENNA